MAQDPARERRTAALINRLRTLRADGPSRGGPHVAITHTGPTREILALGEDAIAPLIQRLPESGFDEAVYIVFLLRELRAVEAQAAVRKLRSQIDARSAGRDMTLKMQIQFYERDLPLWRE